VVVCDGFVGNVLLKFYEALAPTLMGVFARALHAEHDTLADAFKELDYSEHGGAPLLGVRGVSIISHGKSNARAMKNAVFVAVRAVESRMSDHIGRSLAEAGARGDGAALPAPTS
jgi:glycerol-3-phosphate acyltransferase PlsX